VFEEQVWYRSWGRHGGATRTPLLGGSASGTELSQGYWPADRKSTHSRSIIGPAIDEDRNLNFLAIESGQEYVIISAWEIKTQEDAKKRSPRSRLLKRQLQPRLTWYGKLRPARNAKSYRASEFAGLRFLSKEDNRFACVSAHLFLRDFTKVEKLFVVMPAVYYVEFSPLWGC
jgi:hypothetical protein